MITIKNLKFKGNTIVRLLPAVDPTSNWEIINAPTEFDDWGGFDGPSSPIDMGDLDPETPVDEVDDAGEFVGLPDLEFGSPPGQIGSSNYENSPMAYWFTSSRAVEWSWAVTVYPDMAEVVARIANSDSASVASSPHMGSGIRIGIENLPIGGQQTAAVTVTATDVNPESSSYNQTFSWTLYIQGELHG